MKAVVRNAYGGASVLRVDDVEVPTPGKGEVAVRVHGTSVNRGDWYTLRGFPYLMRLLFGLRRPARPGLGQDVSGVVEGLGPGVTEFTVGDRVYTCSDAGASWAELAIVPAAALARAPVSIPLAEAGAIPAAALTALTAVREQADVQPGQEVLVVGGSGSVGSYAVQLARALGGRVTAVCGADHADRARELGAAEVIDYRADDYTLRKGAFDVVIDVAGTRAMSETLSVLKPDGAYISVGFPINDPWLAPILRPLWTLIRGWFVSQKVGVFVSTPNRAQLEDLAELVDAGKLKPAWASRCTLDEMPAAMAEIEAGTRKDKLFVEVRSSATSG